MRTLTQCLALLLLTPLFMLSWSGPAAAADRDCGDFATQAGAQAFYLANGGPASDPHGLDADRNGIACESNPCPCSTGQQPEPTPTTQPTSTPEPEPEPSAPLKVVRVLDGELIKVRQGKAPAYVVHLMGITVPTDRCKARAAVDDLRSWVRPGMVVRSTTDERARNKDRDGHLWRYLVRVKGNWDIGGSQIDTGYAKVQPGLKFQLRQKYVRWATKAKANTEGYYADC